MDAKNTAIAILLLVSSVNGLAADSAPAGAPADKLNLPVLNAPSETKRDTSKAEAADLVKNYRTTLSIQLDQYKP